MTKKLRIDVWSDVVCPWCYIGKRRLERALAAFPHRDRVEVVHRAFQLDPSAPKGAVEDTVTRLATKYGVSNDQALAMIQRVTQVAAADGLQYDLPKTMSGNTFDAHRVLLYAQAQGRGQELLERLYAAYFVEADSVFDHPSLIRLAAEAGLDAAEVHRVLEQNLYADEAEADRHEAGSIGATGVPFFVVGGRYAISGAQPHELFSQVLARAWEETNPVTLVQSAADGDALCDDGSCAVPTPHVPSPSGRGLG